MSSAKKETAHKKKRSDDSTPVKHRRRNPNKAKVQKQQDFVLALLPKLDPKWRSAAISCETERNIFARRNDDYFWTFHSPFVHILIIPHIDDRKKLRRKIKTTTLDTLANQINEKFRLVKSTNFLQFEFLTETDNNKKKNNEFQSKLKEYGLAHLKSYKDLVQTKQVDEKFFHFLEQDRLLEGLVHLMKNNKLGLLLLKKQEVNVVTRTINGDSTMARAMRFSLQTSGCTTELDKLALANHIFQMQLEENNEDNNQHHLEQIYYKSKNIYSSIQTRLEEYRSFLVERYKSTGRRQPRRAEWAVADAKKCFRYIPLLMDRKFQKLDRKQRDDYFRWTQLPENMPRLF
uniref:Uncharacterized protein n=1 Tax=Grammatophora oceanica TaxID=210454 RepID=A0A7S1Y3Q8_9STRA|mmetsp:Transcript_17836/g.26408  ORF Transcript_17836/g.26408 Transcript_17836/m.26408 type:complete len:346 (+) Transcript_17836:284-1321(+)|eukprot:CAMPEP_0194056638 /NCGR_PEP_ID=MMETSP0009_2-20130614/60787_1 /TAXON_ID=210454 /ORGANISM="Grammatophora oceanica, Strain CCMP 410" /LENGTH=345 /DNA_ID=CAMNT_0038706083 /DNA_START=176 /DNA_END=1213 /DNA_ORIENTATION=-